MNTETQLTATDKAAILKTSPLARELTDAEVAVLAGLINVRDFADGEVLVEEGSRDNHLHVVVTGAVSVAKHTPEHGWHVLQLLRPGDLAGELSFMDGDPRYAALVASGATRAFSLEREDLETLLETHPHVVYKAMRAIMRVAHTVQRRLSVQMLEMQNYFLKTGGRY